MFVTAAGGHRPELFVEMTLVTHPLILVAEVTIRLGSCMIMDCLESYIYFVLIFGSSYERIATSLLDHSYRSALQSTTINQHWPGVTNIFLSSLLKLSHEFTS